VRKWHDITQPYRAEAWTECARLVRAHVDREPYDLSTRALLASLLMRARQRPLALMQYERLLPLAVGQGDLFRALATQRRLDELHAHEQRHPDRYRAIQDWFRSVAGAGQGEARARRGGRTGPGALLDLPPEAFSALAEKAQVIALDMTPLVVHEPAGVLWVVYFGDVRWTLVSGRDGTRADFAATEGDMIHLHPGPPSERWMEVAAESPCEVIQLDPELVAVLGRAGAAREPAAERHGDDAAPPAPRAAAAIRRPRPDPVAEPTLAAGMPRDRRREARMAVILEGRMALLGEEGSRAAPLHGTVVDISSAGLGLRFPAVQIRDVRGIHPRAFVHVQVGLRSSNEVLRVSSRIAWIEWRPAAQGEEAGDAHIGLEFVAMSAEARVRLERLLDSVTRAGA
jgi:hypothetical protein